MDVLQSSENLVQKVANVIIAQLLRLQQFVEVSLHETLNNVDILHTTNVCRTNNVPNVNDVFMFKTCQNFNLPQCSLTVRLVLKGRDLFDGHLLLGDIVKCRTVKRKRKSTLSQIWENKFYSVQS